MTAKPDAPPAEPEARDEQINLRLSIRERADLVRRAGERQATIGEEVSLQEYIRSELWPDGFPVAA